MDRSAKRTHGDAAFVAAPLPLPAAAATPEEDFRALFEATYPALVRTLWFVAGDHDAAQEAAQDAFAELYRQWGKVADYDRPDLWVRRVALRKARRELGRTVRRRRAEQQASPGTEAATDAMPDPELIAAIRRLPERQRTAVVLFYLEDRPMEQVASLMGCSTATGFVHLHRARSRLAQLLGEEAPDVR